MKKSTVVKKQESTASKPKQTAPAANAKPKTTIAVEKPKASTAVNAKQATPVKTENKNEVMADKSNTEKQNESVEPIQIHKIVIKQIGAEVYKDASGFIKKNDNKWPLVIDNESNAARTFYRHSDANYVTFLDYELMNSDKLRQSLLGAIRFGKPFVLDIDDSSDPWTTVTSYFERIKENLLERLMSKNLMENENFLEIRKPEDGSDYGDMCFNEVDKFQFIVLTANQKLPDMILKMFTVFAIE